MYSPKFEKRAIILIFERIDDGLILPDKVGSEKSPGGGKSFVFLMDQIDVKVYQH